MPERTKEELEQIRNDFIILKQVYDEELESSGSYYFLNLFNGKSRAEEVEEYRLGNLKILQDLLDSGKIKSCEALTWVEKSIDIWQKPIDTSGWRQFTDHWVVPSHKAKIDDLTFDEIVELLEQAPFDESLNRNLDKIGTDACIIRACNELDLGKIELAEAGTCSNESLPKSKNSSTSHQI